MSFYPQPNKYQCGPFALKYALVMLGQFHNEKVIAAKAGSSWWYGTDEIGLANAANYFDCTMKYFQSSAHADSINQLISYLEKKIPCILSVDNWGHWLAVLNYDKQKFIVVDSGLEKVIVTYSARQLLKRWRYYDEAQAFESYDGYALIPNIKVVTKANFTFERAKFVMRERNADLASKWDSYFNDLINICSPIRPNAKLTMSFTEFVRRHENLLIKQVAYWHGTPSHPELNKILDNMIFVAETYDLIIYARDQKKALIDLSALLMMYTCGKYGMSRIY